MTQVAVIHSAFEETPHTVAFVEVGDRTGSWSIKEEFFSDGEPNGDYNPDVTVMAPLHEGGMGLRSTSMNDQMLMGTKKYKVAMMGFEEIK